MQNSNICLTLEADDIRNITCNIDSSFGTHKGLSSHTGAIMTLGKGSIIAESTKQKVNARSSTEAELVAMYDNKISKIVWIT